MKIWFLACTMVMYFFIIFRLFHVWFYTTHNLTCIQTRHVLIVHLFIHSIGMCRMGWFLAILRSFFHSCLLCTFSCHPSAPAILPSSLTSCCHLFLGLPLNLVFPKFIYNTLLGFLTFRGPCIVSIFLLIYFQQDATTHFIYFWKTALHVSCGISTQHQEHTQLYLQHLVLVKPLLLPAATVELVWVCTLKSVPQLEQVAFNICGFVHHAL